MKATLNWVAFIMVMFTVILVYGCWTSGPVEVIDRDGSMHSAIQAYSEEPNIDLVNSMGRDVFADNFDYVDDELDKAMYAIRLVENRSGDTNAVGDIHLTHKAYGLYQIRQPYLDDINQLSGVDVIKSAWGKDKLTIDDMRDGEKAQWVVRKYLRHYGIIYERKTGMPITAGIYARIHNGGPNGWMRAVTNEYFEKIMKELK